MRHSCSSTLLLIRRVTGGATYPENLGLEASK
jgi:hypothetical protein